MIASSSGSIPSSSRRRDWEDGRAGRLLERLHRLCPGFVVEQIGFGQRDDLGLVAKPCAIVVELAANHSPTVDRIVAGAIDEVEQQAGALDVAEEAVADPGALGSAFDQPGNVGDDEFAALVADHAELRAKGGERISADLGLGVGDGVEES